MQNSEGDQQQPSADEENKKVMSLVLVNEQNTRDNELAKTFTANFTLERRHVGMAIVDAHGEVLNTHIFNYLLVNKQQRPQLSE
jgi:hypothetical protein